MKLLLLVIARSRMIQLLLLPRYMTELSDRKLYENISRTDVTFTSYEMEEVEAVSRTLLVSASWFDCQLFLTHDGQFIGGGKV